MMPRSFIFFIIVSLLGVVCDLLEDLKNCGVRSYYYYGLVSEYYLSCNSDDYRVKEINIAYNNNNVVRKRFFPGNGIESMSFRPENVNISPVDYEFILVNETRVCYRAEFGYDSQCAYTVYEITCQPLPTWKYPLLLTGGQVCPTAVDVNWACINVGSSASRQCQELQVTNLFETVVTKPARVINGFRVNDCEGAVIPVTNDWITVREGEVDLVPAETKQQLVPVNNTIKFIQLMVSVCPRTAVAINDLISSLNAFIRAVDLRTSYIALTVFDGALDYVDLLPFTNKATLINSTIANLTNYVLRDDTCNVRQSIAKKFSEVSAHVYGQPWDTLNFVIYTATGDLVNYIPNDNTVVIPINRRRDISTYVIGQNLPPSQNSLFRALGVRGLFNTQDLATTTGAFTDVAKSINASSSGFNLFGYCSASRVGQINAKLYLKYRGRYGSSTINPGVTIMEQKYNASEFTPGCTANHARDFCSPCSTVIDHLHIMCYDCFNQSSVALSDETEYAQVLLRVPANGRNILHLPVPSSGAQFNVYVRFGGVSNPLLYDFKFLAVSQPTIELPTANKGDLVGVYIDWNGYAYDASLGIAIESPSSSPLTAPLSQAPITAPVPQQETPVSQPLSPIPVSPIAVEPITAPIPQPEVPQSYNPVSSSPYPISSPDSSPNGFVPIGQYPVAEMPVSAPLGYNAPVDSAPIAYYPPVTQPNEAPVAQPVEFSIPTQSGNWPVSAPIVQASPDSAQPQSASGAAAGQNSTDENVSTGVTVQSGLILVLVSLFVAF